LEEIRIANARYDPYASEQSLSTVDSRAMASNPTYLARRYRKLEQEMQEARKKREMKKERKEARKLMVEQQKRDQYPDSKKARKG
jgi:hypothetical protein